MPSCSRSPKNARSTDPGSSAPLREVGRVSVHRSHVVRNDPDRGAPARGAERSTPNDNKRAPFFADRLRVNETGGRRRGDRASQLGKPSSAATSGGRRSARTRRGGRSRSEERRV